MVVEGEESSPDAVNVSQTSSSLVDHPWMKIWWWRVERLREEDSGHQDRPQVDLGEGLAKEDQDHRWRIINAEKNVDQVAKALWKEVKAKIAELA